MQVKATYHDIWHIAYPIMLGAVAQTILGLTDTAFLARVGEVELGSLCPGRCILFCAGDAWHGFIHRKSDTHVAQSR